MDGKDSLCKLLNSLLEISKSMKREMLIDYMMGRETPQILKRGYENLESFASGDNRDEEHWGEVIDQAIEAGYLKQKSDGVGIMAKGKKYLKKPVEFELKSEDDENDFDKDKATDNLDMMVQVYVEGTPQPPKAVSTHRKMAIIQAIDRRVALDDFASNQGLEFQEVMDDIESLIAKGTHIDITYFAEEILGKEGIEELQDYYASVPSDSIDNAIDEYGDVYSEDELRLARVLYRSKKMCCK